MAKRIYEYTGDTYPKITHEAQEVDGLEFKQVFIKNRQFVLIKGLDTKIDEFILKNPDIIISSISLVRALVIDELPTVSCKRCGGLGTESNYLHKIDAAL